MQNNILNPVTCVEQPKLKNHELGVDPSLEEELARDKECMVSLQNRGGHGGEELMSANNTKTAFRSPRAIARVKQASEEMARTKTVPELCGVVKLLYSSSVIFQFCSS